MTNRKPIGRPPVHPDIRFDSHVDKDGPTPPGFETPCWLWTGARSQTGYALIQLGGRMDARRVSVHRYAHERWTGPIPEEWQVDHLCKVRHCVNPAHLEAVPGAVNNARSDSPTAKNARMVLCSRNLHELAGDNLQATYLRRGERRCKACMTERQREYRARKRQLKAS